MCFNFCIFLLNVINVIIYVYISTKQLQYTYYYYFHHFLDFFSNIFFKFWLISIPLKFFFRFPFDISVKPNYQCFCSFWYFNPCVSVRGGGEGRGWREVNWRLVEKMQELSKLQFIVFYKHRITLKNMLPCL